MDEAKKGLGLQAKARLLPKTSVCGVQEMGPSS